MSNVKIEPARKIISDLVDLFGQPKAILPEPEFQVLETLMEFHRDDPEQVPYDRNVYDGMMRRFGLLEGVGVPSKIDPPPAPFVSPFPIGTRVKLRHNVDRFPHARVEKDALGTVTKIDDDLFEVKLDDQKGLELSTEAKAEGHVNEHTRVGMMVDAMSRHAINLTTRERDTVLAALRFYQGKFDHHRLYRTVKGSLGLDEHDAMVCNIADNDHGNPLDIAEIDDLCERINQ